MLKIAWAPVYILPLPANHRFPMLKYELLPQQLLYEGTVVQENFFEPAGHTEADILRTHDNVYWQKLKNLGLSKSEIRKTGFPLTHELVHREVTIMQGSIQAALFALKFGVAMNIAGGTHHAFTDRGEGFCLLNDIAVAADYLLFHRFVKQVLVVDLDVHQGNGTAQIFSNRPEVFTFSMHGASNYPMHKERSDLDVALADRTGDAAYMRILKKHLEDLIKRIQPEFIFYQAGVDVLESDKLGRLSLSLEGCKARDLQVLDICRINKIPIAVSMGGGYSEKIAIIIEAHANTFRLAQQIFF